MSEEQMNSYRLTSMEDPGDKCVVTRHRMKNIIFDFDGTLADTSPLIIKTMQATIKEMALPPKTEEECRATIGLRLEDIPSVLWPELEDIHTRYALTYRRIFDELKRPLKVQCFPGVKELIKHLHTAGYGLAIASSRSHKSLKEYIELFGLSDCFSCLIGGDDVTNGKPAPDPVLAILGSQRWNPAETLTVGDAAVDIFMGQAAITKTCAVTYGNGTLIELESANPDFIISSFSELLPIMMD